MPQEESEEKGETVYTTVIGQAVSLMSSDEELLEYLKTHAHNFALKNKKAKELLHQQIEIAKKKAQKERKKYWRSFERGLEKAETREYRRDQNSINLLYDTIFEGIASQGAKGTKTIFANAELPKEIKNSFPEPMTFSKLLSQTTEPTYEEIRKMLILLFSYNFWVEARCNDFEVELDDYVDQLNALLTEAGLAEMYYGNPHDWLYMYCTLEDNSLDCFRDIFNKVIDKEPEID